MAESDRDVTSLKRFAADPELVAATGATATGCYHIQRIYTPILLLSILVQVKNSARCRPTGWSKKRIQFYFWDNFGNLAPILTILLLLQAEIYGA